MCTGGGDLAAEYYLTFQVHFYVIFDRESYHAHSEEHTLVKVNVFENLTVKQKTTFEDLKEIRKE